MIKDNHARICRYLLSCADYVSEPTEYTKLLEIVCEAYRKSNQLCDSLRVAMKLSRPSLVTELFAESKGYSYVETYVINMK